MMHIVEGAVEARCKRKVNAIGDAFLHPFMTILTSSAKEMRQK